VKTWNAHGGVQSVEFFRDGKLLTCGRDHQVKLWTADGKQQGPNLALGEMAMRAATTFDNSRIIAGDWAGDVRVWNAADGKQIGTLSADPPLISERLKVANAELEKHRVDHDRLAAAAAASIAQMSKTAADLDGAQLAMNSAGEAEKTVHSELAELQKSIEHLNSDAAGLKTELANEQSASELLADAIAKAQQAAEKLPGDDRVADTITHLKSAADSVASTLASTQKSLEEKTHSLGESQANVAGMQKRQQKLASEIAAARQRIEALTAAAKASAEQAAADAKALAPATRALESAQTELQHWSEELEFAKSAVQPSPN
jgi:chromosome segregation ATPase